MSKVHLENPNPKLWQSASGEVVLDISKLIMITGTMMAGEYALYFEHIGKVATRLQSDSIISLRAAFANYLSER